MPKAKPEPPKTKRQAQRAAVHAISGTGATQKLSASEAGKAADSGRSSRLSRDQWLEVFDLARELARKSSIDNAMRACNLSAEMLGLLADCARGEGTFVGAAASVRRLAALDILTIANGAPGQEEWRQHRNGNENDSQIVLPSNEMLRQFIEAGSERLAHLRAKATATDAEVVAQQSCNSQATDGSDRGADGDTGGAK